MHQANVELTYKYFPRIDAPVLRWIEDYDKA